MTVRIPPRYDFRLEDLRRWHIVEAECGGCRHRARIPHPVLMAGRPSYTRLVDLEAKLRCSRCGATSGLSLTIRMQGRD